MILPYINVCKDDCWDAAPGRRRQSATRERQADTDPHFKQVD